MKKFVQEKYADAILQLCTGYKNKYPSTDNRTSQAVSRALETLDKYSYYILGMGYMLHVEDIKYLREYVSTLDVEKIGDIPVANLNEYLQQLAK